MTTITRGIRGAINVGTDTPESILDATRELLHAIIDANDGLTPDNIASIFFTSTTDLVSVHPALAARQMGWKQVPLMCAKEIDVPGSLPKVIRVLIHWNTECLQDEVCHVYLGDAVSLRPDLHISPQTLQPLVS